jgi:hypothetical protein
MPDELRNISVDKTKEELMDMDPVKDLDRQFNDIKFGCTMTCLSLIRFITDHMESLPAAIIHQLMENNDIPLVLVPLLEYRPWLRTNAKGV